MSERPAHPARQASIDLELAKKLEKQLSERPDKSELVDRNILKDDKGISPGLVAAREQLQQSQLKDKLEHALEQRPNPDELLKKNILQPDEAPATEV
ncbi:hypothetical protein DL96DRAFT_1176192 [Flagelloscypha sp. PMI_526]|nr:hypothetical protein DL96DRAFT_1176192 [Flagelloscypha sp. PMI_526]